MKNQENPIDDLLPGETLVQQMARQEKSEAIHLGVVLAWAFVAASLVPTIICWTANNQTAVHLVKIFRYHMGW